MNNPDHISESLETSFWVKILKLFHADPGSGMKKNSDMGSGINIPDLPHLYRHTFAMDPEPLGFGTTFDSMQIQIKVDKKTKHQYSISTYFNEIILCNNAICTFNSIKIVK
jgi:hypothetical protein